MQILGKSGQIGSSINRIVLQKTLMRNSDVLILANGSANSDLSDDLVEEEFKRFIESLEIVRSLSFSKLVLLSSGGSVYGPGSTEPIFESMAIAPKTPYGVLKVRCEDFVTEIANECQAKLMVLRISNVYSTLERGIFGALARSIFSNSPFVLKVNPRSQKQYGMVEDYAQLIVDLAGNDSIWETIDVKTVFNIYSPYIHSIQDIIDMFCFTFNRSLQIDYREGYENLFDTVILKTNNMTVEKKIRENSWTKIDNFLKRFR